MEFYAKVFKTKVGEMLTYGEAPSDPNNPLPEADKDRIMYAGIPVGDMVVMFMDMPSGFPLAVGNNINPTVNMEDKDEITRVFNELKEGGEVLAELGKTFFSEWYGMVQDKFGVIWHLIYYISQ